MWYSNSMPLTNEYHTTDRFADAIAEDSCTCNVEWRLGTRTAMNQCNESPLEQLFVLFNGRLILFLYIDRLNTFDLNSVLVQRERQTWLARTFSRLFFIPYSSDQSQSTTIMCNRFSRRRQQEKWLKNMAGLLSPRYFLTFRWCKPNVNIENEIFTVFWRC